MFINSGASISITLEEVNYGSPNYTTYVRATSGGIVRNLTGKILLTYIGSGKQIPFYVGALRK